MVLEEVVNILEAEVLCGEEHLTEKVKSVCGSDMMSEVLAFTSEQSVLLTGLCNTQVLRTAEMLDLMCVIFIRGKKPTEEMLEMAKGNGIVILATKLGMFTACGRLYEAGAVGGNMS